MPVGTVDHRVTGCDFSVADGETRNNLTDQFAIDSTARCGRDSIAFARAHLRALDTTRTTPRARRDDYRAEDAAGAIVCDSSNREL